jgi:hypothetical protein
LINNNNFQKGATLNLWPNYGISELREEVRGFHISINSLSVALEHFYIILQNNEKNRRINIQYQFDGCYHVPT